MKEKKEVVVEAENIDLAIDKGLKELSLKREEVEVEIINKGRRGFFGIGSKAAKVKLTAAANNHGSEDSGSEEEEEEQGRNSSEQSSIYLADNQLYLDKSRVDRYPVIESDKYITLYHNGQLTDDSIVLSPQDKIRVEAKDKGVVSEIKLRTTADGMEAYIMLVEECGIEFVPKIIPKLEKDKGFLITGVENKELRPPQRSPAEIKDKLANKDITFGIQEEKIEEVLANPNQEFLIAKGRAPEEGEDGVIEYLFKNDFAEDDLSETREKVDYFSLHQIASVKRGEVIAKKHPPQPGETGFDIYGNQLEVAEVEDVEWQIGQGVKLSDERAIAVQAGRPVVEGGKLFITETYVIEGNVDNRVGNIDFDGNVIVKGDVKENFKIRARGKIEVAGNVNQALLEANDGIIVHGSTIGSELVTGKLSAFYKDSYFYLNKLGKLFSKMKQAVKQLKGNSSFKTRDLQENGERQILQLLLDTKYQKIVKLLEEFYELSAEVDLDKVMDELRKLLHLLKESINKKGLCKMDYITEFIKLGARIDSVYNRLSRFDFDASDVVVNYLQNSRVVANGKILVEGKGVYNSNLRASSQIRVTGAQGFVRGGKIKAQDDIFIKELGSPRGSEVSVSVPQEHKIKSTKMNINTLLKIGGQKYRLQKDWHEVSAEIDKQGNFNIT